MIDTIKFRISEDNFNHKLLSLPHITHQRDYYVDAVLERESILLEFQYFRLFIFSDSYVLEANLNEFKNGFSYVYDNQEFDIEKFKRYIDEFLSFFVFDTQQVTFFRIDMFYDFHIIDEVIGEFQTLVLQSMFRRFETKLYPNKNIYSTSKKLGTRKFYDKTLDLRKKHNLITKNFIYRFETEYSKVSLNYADQKNRALKNGIPIIDISNRNLDFNLQNIDIIYIDFVDRLMQISKLFQQQIDVEGYTKQEVERAFYIIENDVDVFSMYQKTSAYKYRNLVNIILSNRITKKILFHNDPALSIRYIKIDFI